MIDSINGQLEGLDINELLRKQLKKDPLEEILNPDPAALLKEAVIPSKDTLSVSPESLEAASSLLSEFNSPKDYAQAALDVKRMDAEMAMDALSAEVNALDYMSAEMRDAVLDAAAKGALKKREDVYEASEKNVAEIKDDIERAAAEAVAPKDANGKPIETLGQSPAPQPGTAGPVTVPQAAPNVGAAGLELAAAPVITGTPARVAPALNITV